MSSQVPEEKQQQGMAMVIMTTVGLEKEKYRLGHTKVQILLHLHPYPYLLHLHLLHLQVFFRAGVLGMMEEFREERVGHTIHHHLPAHLTCTSTTLHLHLTYTCTCTRTTLHLHLHLHQVTRITSWLQSAARGCLSRLQYLKLRWPVVRAVLQYIQFTKYLQYSLFNFPTRDVSMIYLHYSSESPLGPAEAPAPLTLGLGLQGGA